MLAVLHIVVSEVLLVNGVLETGTKEEEAVVLLVTVVVVVVGVAATVVINGSFG